MKRRTRAACCLLLMLLCLFAQPLMAQAQEISIYVNGSCLSSDAKPWLSENNRLYMPLRAIATALGFSCEWDGKATALLQNEGVQASITLGSSYYTVNGIKKHADTYPLAYKGRILAPVRALAEALSAEVEYDAASSAVYISTAKAPSGLKGRKIVLDAGHGLMQPGGWTDPGAVGQNGLAERDAVLDVAVKAAALLRQAGAEVILTRNKDYTYLSLAQRAAYASNYGADLLISIHCNASTDKQIKGTAMYTLRNGANKAADEKLAAVMQKSVSAALGTRNLGLFDGNYGVLRGLPCPGLIAELAFISNAEEERLLATTDFRQKAAQGIYEGISRYLGAE